MMRLKKISRMNSDKEGSVASIRRDGRFCIEVLRERRRKWRSIDPSWFRRTMAKQWRISEAVGCFGAGWILWRWEKEGKMVSSERYRAAGSQKKHSWITRV